MKLPPCFLPILDWGAKSAGKTFTNYLIAAVNVTVITARIRQTVRRNRRGR
jgi:hypothetical protein